MKLLRNFLLLLSISFSIIAVAEEPKQTTPSAKMWLERLSHSLKILNFTTSFVVVKNNQAEPYHWFHGVDDNDKELEIFARLNGPRRDILRKDSIISYIEPKLAPYSIESNTISGPIPSIFSGDITQLENSYDFISVGRSRVLGRSAQLIRIVSKDHHRFGYWLWLDQNTGLLLKFALITRKGQLLEQVQFTHLDISNELSDSLKQLQSSDLPSVLDFPNTNQNNEFSWKVKWLPTGFKPIQSNRHRIALTKQPVEFMLFNDGLVDVSIYVNASADKQRSVEYVLDGATVLLNQVVDGFDISVIGKIPFKTAKKIADSLQFTRTKKP